MATHNPTKIEAKIGAQDIIVTREFNAPRDLVFRAYTDPQLYRNWLGPRELQMTIETFEPKAGGRYRYIHRDKNGKEFAFHGVYHEVKSPERIIDTMEFEGLPEKGHAVLESVKFESLPGNRTKLVSKSVFLTSEDRDGMLNSDMEKGINESHERLDDLLEKEKGKKK